MRTYFGGFTFRTVTAGNTQVRRLGYLTAISEVIPSSTPSIDSVTKNLLYWADKNHKYLIEYARERDGQGAINPKYPSGARRYLNVADGLEFVARMGDRIVLSRFGNLLGALASLEKPKNPFFLSHAEILFYTYWLLLNDADFLMLVMDAIPKGRGLEVGDLQAQFQNSFLRRLEAKLNLVSDLVGRQELSDAIGRARNKWKSPRRYAEHIVPTRAGWLLDLGFLKPSEFKKKRYVLNNQGAYLRQALEVIPSTNLRDVTGEWLWERSFSHIEESLKTTTNKTSWNSLSDQERLSLLENPMKEAYEHFLLLGMQACSMLPSLIYCVIVLTVRQNIKVDLADIASWIDEFGASAGFPYRIRLSPLETDSYIQIVD